MSAGAIERIAVRNFRGIGACDVRLGRLTCLVGRNGSGKSSFLDVPRFVRDALTGSLDNALHERGGLAEVRRRSSGHPHHVGVRLELLLGDGRKAVYAFEIGATRGGGHEVTSERCAIDGGTSGDFYVLKAGEPVSHGEFPFPAVMPDRLALVALSGMTAFRPVFDHLTRAGFYDPDPKTIRELQLPQDGHLLKSGGENIASVVAHLERHAPDALRAIVGYLRLIVPSIRSVTRERLGHVEMLEFREGAAGAEHPWRFPARNMSDGTLRALGTLVALFQGDAGFTPTLVGIEEPETALHPAAGAVLRDALRLASERVQVIVTNHSPDLLDDPELDEGVLLAASATDGETRIAALDEASRDAMRRHLFTAGELLRLDRLAPDPDASDARPERQLELFAEPPG